MKTRRQFLGDCGKMSGIGALSSVLNLNLINNVWASSQSSLAQPSDFKALVCIYLGGGNDSFNMLAPGNEGFADYTSTRQHVALAKGNMHRIVDQSNLKDYHLHPKLSQIKNIFDQRDIAFLANVGSLIEPMTVNEFQSKAKRRPTGLFSHFEQSTQWQTSLAHQRGSKTGGWVGRMQDLLNDTANSHSIVNPNFSLGGNNTIQQGIQSSGQVVSTSSLIPKIYNNSVHVKNAFTSLREKEYASILEGHYEYVKADTLEQNALINNALTSDEINTVFPNSSLGQQLKNVILLIKNQSKFESKRQTFFVKKGNFDIHAGDFLTRHEALMQDLSECLIAFNSALKEIGAHESVVSFTASDFGRSVSPNGRGTDHGWGGNHIVMGGPVNGGQVYGEYPSLALNSSSDVGRGRQLPSLSVDQLGASLAQWFGIPNDHNLETVLPNIRNFHNAGSNEYAISQLFS